MGRVRKDLTGQRFGRWLVKEFIGSQTDKVKGRHAQYTCVCDCGTEKVIIGYTLTNGNSVSCGCYRSDWCKANLRHSPGSSARNAIYLNYKRRAKKSGLEFSLSRDEFKAFSQQRCQYCGTPPSRTRTITANGMTPEGVANSSFTYNGIDRVDSSKGYIVDNCVTACWDCNQAKMDRTLTDFLAWIKRTYEYLSSQKII